MACLFRLNQNRPFVCLQQSYERRWHTSSPAGFCQLPLWLPQFPIDLFPPPFLLSLTTSQCLLNASPSLAFAICRLRCDLNHLQAKSLTNFPSPISCFSSRHALQQAPCSHSSRPVLRCLELQLHAAFVTPRELLLSSYWSITTDICIHSYVA